MFPISKPLQKIHKKKKRKKALKPSNKKIGLMSFQFALAFSTFVPLVSWALWDLILFLISLSVLSKNNAVTNFLLEVNRICSPDFFWTRNYGKLISSLWDFFLVYSLLYTLVTTKVPRIVLQGGQFVQQTSTNISNTTLLNTNCFYYKWKHKYFIMFILQQ